MPSEENNWIICEKMKKYDIFCLILDIIFIIFGIICGIFINQKCFILLIAPIGNILIIFYKTRQNEN